MLVFAPVADSIKLYFFANKEFLCFLLRSYIILLSVIFFSTWNKTLKLNNENRKTKKKSYIGSATEAGLLQVKIAI